MSAIILPSGNGDESSALPPPNKEAKLNLKSEDGESAAAEGVHANLGDLSAFQVDEIVHNNTNRKTVCLRGTFESQPGAALILLEKSAFAEENFLGDAAAGGYFHAEKDTLQKVFHNDIYGNYEYYPQLKLNCMCLVNIKLLSLLF